MSKWHIFSTIHEANGVQGIEVATGMNAHGDGPDRTVARIFGLSGEDKATVLAAPDLPGARLTSAPGDMEMKMVTEAQAREKIKWLSRDARRFLGAEPAFDASLEYESDVDGLVAAHPSWVSIDEDLTDLGRAVRAVLLADPNLIAT